MQYQMDFWPTKREAPYAQTQWGSLSIEEQTETITRLARIIVKTVCLPLKDTPKEDNHEQ